MADIEKYVAKFGIGQHGQFRKGVTTHKAGTLLSPQTVPVSRGKPGGLTFALNEQHQSEGHTSYWHTYDDGYYMVVSFHWHYSPDIGHTYRENVLLTKDKKDFYAHCAQYISYFSIEEEGNGDQYLCYTFDIRTAGRIEGTSGSFFSGEPGDEKLNIDDLTPYEFGDTPVPEME